MELMDRFGRKINYMRMSITDRCNFRCRYCMPASGLAKLRHEDILSYEELLMVAEAAVSLGVEKIRLTGGEPLVRKGVINFLHRLRSIPGLKHLVLTTNGHYLAEMAGDLAAAGVQRLNISLDSLRPTTFSYITRGGDLRRVLDGIAAAESVGLPIKINMVVMRGINDDEIIDFASLTMSHPYTVRFIEYMPTVGKEGWQSLLVPGEELLRKIQERFPLRSLPKLEGTGPARNYRIDGAKGDVGVITPVSGHFCGECNRMRITSSGKAKSCLFSSEEVDIKPLTRSGNFEGLVQAMREMVGIKPEGHNLAAGRRRMPVVMSQVGG